MTYFISVDSSSKPEKIWEKKKKMKNQTHMFYFRWILLLYLKDIYLFISYYLFSLTFNSVVNFGAILFEKYKFKFELLDMIG